QAPFFGFRQGVGDCDLTGAGGAKSQGDNPCYANSRLLQLPRCRWARPHWRRPPPRPGVAVAGTVGGMAVAAGTVAGAAVGTTAGAADGVLRASMSAAP